MEVKITLTVMPNILSTFTNRLSRGPVSAGAGKEQDLTTGSQKFYFKLTSWPKCPNVVSGVNSFSLLPLSLSRPLNMYFSRHDEKDAGEEIRMESGRSWRVFRNS